MRDFPSPSAQVSALGGEAGFSPCSHPDRDEDEQTKKQEIEKT